MGLISGELMKSAHELKVVDFDQGRHVLRYRPRLISTVDDFQEEVVLIADSRAGSLTPNPKRSFVTFGSCFAVNLAASLKTKGANVYTTMVTEDINSPSNNRMMLRRLFLGERCKLTDDLQEHSNVNYDEMLKGFSEATDIIFTLGNIFRIKNNSGHTIRATRDAWLVSETFAETVECLTDVLAMLKKYTNAKIFVSVSPIPISGYMGSEFSTVMEADCTSKCQLVTAIKSLNGFTYIPTFEIFRWLAAHQRFSAFGEEGRSCRHLSPKHIEMVMGVLCR